MKAKRKKQKQKQKDAQFDSKVRHLYKWFEKRHELPTPQQWHALHSNKVSSSAQVTQCKTSKHHP